jgi:hypothetical protein
LALGVLAAVACMAQANASAVVTQLADDSSASAQSLVDSLLGANSGISLVAGSASYAGAASASGLFTNGGTGANGLGIDSGVVLTSGDARFIGSSAAFPGDSANKSVAFTSGIGNALTENTSGGNALFDAMAGANGNTNASVLTFSFVPTGSTMKLSFVYGSEDYGYNVGTGFPTDVMGVFVNGVNQAFVPGTTDAVSASTINCAAGSSTCALYRDNPTFSDAIDTELNGTTTLITLSMAVKAGQVNTVSIGVADTFDNTADSALMLKAGSVSAVPEPASIALMLAGLGLTGAAAARRRRG